MNKALFQLHIAILLWGATAVLGKLIHLDETWLVWYRAGITCISLLVLNFFIKEIAFLSPKKAFPLVGAGVLLGLHWMCFFASVKYANVAVSLICLSSTSLFTVLFESFFFNQKIKKKSLLLSLLAIVSVTLLFYSDFTLQKGVVYGILSAIFVAVVPVLQKQQTKLYNTSTISFYNMLGAFVALSITIPIYTQFIPQLNYLPTNYDWLYLLILSWACTIVTLRLALTSLKTISAFTQNLLLNLEPVYGIALAAIILREYKNYNLYFYIGIGILLLAISIQTYLIKKEHAV